MLWWASPVEASSFSRLTKKRSARPRSAIAVQRKESRPDLALEKGADWSFFVAMIAIFFRRRSERTCQWLFILYYQCWSTRCVAWQSSRRRLCVFRILIKECSGKTILISITCPRGSHLQGNTLNNLWTVGICLAIFSILFTELYVCPCFLGWWPLFPSCRSWEELPWAIQDYLPFRYILKTWKSPVLHYSSMQKTHFH